MYPFNQDGDSHKRVNNKKGDNINNNNNNKDNIKGVVVYGVG
jgi:hypothetical protein